jgi:hypothetical protein
VVIETQQFTDALRNEAEALLEEAGIHNFNSYGWLNAYDADPDFVGHAMWQTDDPLDSLLYFDGVNEPAPHPPAPEWQRRLALAGADLEGLMQAARISIGLFLIQAKLSREKPLPFMEEDLFDLHWMSSIVYLSTASDRILALFIAATFRTSTDEYAKGSYNGQKRSWYTTPFLEARDSMANPSPTLLTEALNAAALLADKIKPLRNKRNKLIHELATAIAQRKRALLERRPLSAKPRNLDFPSLQKAIKEMEARHKRELSKTIKQLADWYELLVRGSNEVFIVEHYRRSQPI